MVFLPPWREWPDGVVETYLGWGEVEPELFGRFLSREEPLPPVMLALWPIGGRCSGRRTRRSGRW